MLDLNASAHTRLRICEIKCSDAGSLTPCNEARRGKYREIATTKGYGRIVVDDNELETS
jgi:hypothetical protein